MLPQPSQSLVIPELQLSEVLDGADHLRGVAVLVVVPGHDLHLVGVQPAKRAVSRVCGSLSVGLLNSFGRKCLPYLIPDCL